MKALVIADRAPDIDILATIKSESIDLVITLGDLSLWEIQDLSGTAIPKIGVYGNHCTGTYLPKLGIRDMHLNTWDFQGLRFGGFQGCVRYKRDNDAIMFTQVEANTLMRDFPKVDVFISHCPPRGINDEEALAHQGFDALLKYLDEQQPRVWLHGHTYPTEETLVKQYGASRIEYVFRQRVITL